MSLCEAGRGRSQRPVWFAILAFVSLLPSSNALAMPMWARRYGLSCTACHAYPSLQLTSMGLDFFRRGHRFEADAFDKNAMNLLSAHGEWNYTVQEGQSTAFPHPEFHLHGGGALNSHFSGYVDANVNSDFEALYIQFTQEHGDKSYFTARAGKISPTIVRNYGNGLMASASTPLIITDTTLSQNPFTPSRDSFGIDVGQRWNAVFIQAGVTNGDDVAGQATVGNHKDAYATLEVNAPSQPSGVALYYHHGAYQLGDPTAGPLLGDDYYRAGVFANFTRDKFRLAGAYLFGKDTVQTVADRKIRGYYIQADVHPWEWVAPFARYDWVKTEAETVADRVELVTIGSSFQLFQSEITAGRAVLEFSRRSEAGTKTNAAVLNLLWAF